MDDNEAIARIEAEGAVYLLAGSILREMPRSDWLAALAEGGLFDEIPFAADNAHVQRGAETLRAWAQSWREEDTDGIYSDCMALLVGPGEPLAAPWESVYSEKNEGLVFQQETLDVRRAYRSFGLQIDKLHHEPDDHIGYELEFVSTLCARAAAAAQEGRPEEARNLLKAKDSFVRDHLSKWAFAWCDRMDQHAKTAFYRGMSLLVRGFLEESRSLRA